MEPRIGLVSTISCECGIATYSEHLVAHYPKNDCIIFGNNLDGMNDTGAPNMPPIIRCFSKKGIHEDLLSKIIQSGVNVVHFQHEFGLFQNHESFVNLLKTLKQTNRIRTVITFHTVFTKKEWNWMITDYIPYLDRIIVHTESAKEVLGLGTNCFMIPHGSVIVKPKPRTEARKYFGIPEDKFVVLTLGFITPTKGAIDNIIAVNRLKNKYPNLFLLIAGFAVVPDNNYTNLEYALELFKNVKAANANEFVKIMFKFIPESELDYFAGASDVAIENYYDTQFSTSGMSHLMMSYGLPNISSRSNILSDLNEQRSIKYDVKNLDQMTDALDQLIGNELLRKTIRDNCLKYADETSWSNTAKRHYDLYDGIPF